MAPIWARTNLAPVVRSPVASACRCRLAPPSLTIFTQGLTGTWIEDELTSSGDQVFQVVIVEIEHVPKRSSQLVERSAPDLAGAPVFLDETQHRALVGQRVVDEVLFSKR
jgi:hypothetical protein